MTQAHVALFQHDWLNLIVGPTRSADCRCNHDNGGLMLDFYIAVAMPADTSGVAIVTVTGEVDAYTAGRLQNAIVAVIDGDVQTCIVDLTGVRFLDSSGMSALVEARHVLDAKGVALRTCTGERVHALFEIAGMVEYLDAKRDGVEALDFQARCRPSSTTSAPPVE